MKVGMAYYTGQISTAVWWHGYERGWSMVTTRLPPAKPWHERRWRWSDVSRPEKLVQHDNPVPVRRLMHFSHTERRRWKRRRRLHDEVMRTTK